MEQEPAGPSIPYLNLKRFLRNTQKWTRIFISKPPRGDHRSTDRHMVYQPAVVELPTWASSANPTHNCLQISEIFCLICEFIRADPTVGKSTLASLARTCRSFNGPALDALWMRLDLLDPLIKVLPEWMWAEKHNKWVIRMRSKEEHWLTFRKYAERVRFVHGPCWEIPASVQRRIIPVLARFPEALPLLPNLTELVWSDLATSKLQNTSVSLLRYFVGPRVAAISVFLGDSQTSVSFDSFAPFFEVLSLCPNATSFATFHIKPGHFRGKRIDAQWREVCERQSSLFDWLAIGVELNGSTVHRFPETVQEFSLKPNGVLPPLLHPNKAPMTCHIHCPDTICNAELLLGDVLPNNFNMSQLQSLSIAPRPLSDTTYITKRLVVTLLHFSTLQELDMDTLGSEALKDEHYRWLAQALPELRILKVGTVPTVTEVPEASIEAVLAVLKGCKHLETLHMLFNASGIHGDLGRSVDTRAILNERITRIHVGYSTIKSTSVYALATCLGSVMPRLEMVEWNFGAGFQWGRVQEMISCSPKL